MLTGEDWTKGTGATTTVKGFIWFTEGSKMRKGPELQFMGNL